MMLDLPFRVCAHGNFFKPSECQTLELSNVSKGNNTGDVDVLFDISSRHALLKSPHYVIDELAGPIDFGLYTKLPYAGASEWEHSCLSSLKIDSKKKIILSDNNGDKIQYTYNQSTKSYLPPIHSFHASCSITNIKGGYLWYNPDIGEKKTYSSYGYLESFTNEHGHVLEYKYKFSLSGYYLRKIKSSSGSNYRFEWESLTKLNILKEESGHKTLLIAYEFSEGSNLQLSKVDIFNEKNTSLTTNLSYNKKNILQSVVKYDGEKVSFKYNKTLLDGICFEHHQCYFSDPGEIFSFFSDKEKQSLQYQLFLGDQNKLHEIKNSRSQLLTCYEWSEDINSLVDKKIHADFSYTKYTYDQLGRVMLLEEFDVKDISLQKTSFEYDAEGSLSKVNYSGEETYFIYRYLESGERYLQYKIGPSGNVEHYIYENKQCSQVHQLFKKYSGDKELEAIDEWCSRYQDQPTFQSVSRIYTHKDNGQISSIMDGQSQTTFVKSLTGALLKRTQENDLKELIETCYERDSVDRGTLFTTAQGNQTSCEYDKVITENDETFSQEKRTLPNGLKVNETFNQSRRVMKREYSDGSLDAFEYDDKGRLYFQKNRDGLVKYQFYDDNGHLLYQINGSGELVFYENNIRENIKITTQFNHRLELDAEPYLSIESKGRLLNSIEQFITEHKSAVDNRVEYQLNDPLGQEQFKITKATKDNGYVVQEKKHGGNHRQIANIQYEKFLNHSEVEELIKSRKFPEDKKNRSKDRVHLFIYHQGEEIAQIDAAGYVALNTFNGAGLLVEKHHIQKPLSMENMQRLLYLPSKELLEKFITPDTVSKASREIKYYHDNGKVALSIDAKGYVEQYEYDSQNQLKSSHRFSNALKDIDKLTTDVYPELPIENIEDKLITYVYNADGHCIEEHHINDGYKIIKSYDELGNIQSESKQDNNGMLIGDCYREKKTYRDLHGKVNVVINPLVCLIIKKIEENSDLTQADKKSKIQALVDKHGEKTHRDLKGRVLSSSDAEGNITHYLYGLENRIACSISPEGALIAYDYNAFGEVESTQSSKTFVDVDAFLDLFEDNNFDKEKMLSLKDKKQQLVKFITETSAYNPLGLIEAKIDGDGFYHKTDYNSFSQISTEEIQIDETHALIHENEYENRGLPTEKRTKTNNSASIKTKNKKYESAMGLCTYEKEDDGQELSHEYDFLGRCEKTSAHEVNVKTGHLSEVTLKQQSFDAFNRLVKEETPLSQSGFKTRLLQHSRQKKSVTMYDEGQEDSAIKTTHNIYNEDVCVKNEIDREHYISHTAAGHTQGVYEKIPSQNKRLIETNQFKKNGLKLVNFKRKATKDVETNYEHNKDGALTQETQGDCVLHHYKRDAIGNAVEHTDSEGCLTTHTFDDRNHCIESIVDPDNLAIKTKESFNGLGQRASQTLSDKRHKNSYKVNYANDEHGQTINKTLDPDDSNIENTFKRNRAGHITSETDGNGNTHYKVINADGKPLLAISAEGNVKAFEYDHRKKVSYVRHYKKPLTEAQIQALLSSDSFKASNDKHDWSSLYEALNDIASVDDKQVSFFYNNKGNKSCEIKHFYDHKDKTHKAYISKFEYSKTSKITNKSLSKHPIAIDDIQAPESDGHNIKLALSQKFFSKSDLHTKIVEHNVDISCDRQSWFIYDESDDLVFTINADGAITEKIYNDEHQVVHKIEYATLLSENLLLKLKQLPQVEHTAFLLNEIKPRANAWISELSDIKLEHLHSHYVFDKDDNPIFTVDSKGLVIRKYFDKNNKVLTEIHFSTPFILADHQDIGNIDASLFENYCLEKITDDDRVYQNGYDTAGRLEREVDPNGNEDIYERDAADLIVKHTDRNGAEFCTEYDCVRRHIADISPEVEVTSISTVGEGNEAKLQKETIPRSVRNEIKYKNTSAPYKKIQDVGGDERSVTINRDKDDRAVGTEVDDIEVDDALRTPQHLFDRPTKSISCEVHQVLNDSGLPLVNIDEEGNLSFIVYDALDRIVYEVNALGLVTFYERDDYGHPLTTIQYEKPLQLPLQQLAQLGSTGIPASMLDEARKQLSTNNDRIKIYTYNNEGKLLSSSNGERLYFNPVKKTFYQACGLQEQSYDAFNRVTRQRTLVSKDGAEVWKYHYFWYEAGQQKPACEAESVKCSIDEPDNLFKFTSYKRDVFGNCAIMHEYTRSIELNETEKKYSVNKIKQFLTGHQSKHDIIRHYTFTMDNEEKTVKLVNAWDAGEEHLQSIPSQELKSTKKSKKINKIGQIPKKDEKVSADEWKLEFEGTYTKTGKLAIQTDEDGYSSYVFIDALNQTLAKIGMPVISAENEDGTPVYQYPLTHYFYNGHKEEVGSEEFFYGTDKPLYDVLTMKPVPIKRDVEKDILNLTSLDKRGLKKIIQKDTQQTSLTHGAKQNEVRSMVSRLSDIHSEDARCIDEKISHYDPVSNVVGEDRLRNGERINSLSFEKKYNSWSEGTEKKYLHEPKIKSITKWSQGFAWYTELDKNLPTLQFRNMLDDITLSVTSHDDILRNFTSEKEAADFVLHNLYNNRVLKDIKTYNFSHNALKHERPSTKVFGPNGVSVYVGTNFSDNGLLSLSWVPGTLEFTPFARVIDQTGISVLPNADAITGLSKATLINGHYSVSLAEVPAGTYTAEIFYFNANALNEAGYPGIESQPVYASHNEFQCSQEPFYFVDNDNVEALNIHLRFEPLGAVPHETSLRVNFNWDKFPIEFSQSTFLIHGTVNKKGYHLKPIVGNNSVECVMNYYDYLQMIAQEGQVKPHPMSIILPNGLHIPVINIGKATLPLPNQKKRDFKEKHLSFFSLENSELNNNCILKVGDTTLAYEKIMHEGKAIGIVFERGKLQGEISISRPDFIFPAKGGMPVYQDSNLAADLTNRIAYSNFDVYQNLESSCNEEGFVWQYKQNAHHIKTLTIDPEIESFVPEKDALQGNLVLKRRLTSKITQEVHDLKNRMTAVTEGYIDIEKNQKVLKPSSKILYSPNGELFKNTDPTNVVINKVFRNALSLATSLIGEGFKVAYEVIYKGKKASQLIFHGVNVGGHMSSSSISYDILYDDKTMEIVGLGVPSSTFNDGNNHQYVRYRRDSMSQINTHKLPGGQVNKYIKDANDNTVNVEAHIGSATYAPHPFSGVIQEMTDHNDGADWKYLHTGLNLERERKQLNWQKLKARGQDKKVIETLMKGGNIVGDTAPLIPESSITEYQAELVSSVKSDSTNTASVYERNKVGDVIKLNRHAPHGNTVITGARNGVRHLTKMSSSQFSQAYYSDPYYNQVLSVFSLTLDNGSKVNVTQGNSFDDAHRIVRNNVSSTQPNDSGFILHMPSESQGGIRIYDVIGRIGSELFYGNTLHYGYDDIGRFATFDYHGISPNKKYLLYDVSGFVRHNILGSAAINDAREPSKPALFHQNRYGNTFNSNFGLLSSEDSFQAINTVTKGFYKNDGVTVNISNMHQGAYNSSYQNWQDMRVCRGQVVQPISMNAKLTSAGDQTPLRNPLLYLGEQISGAIGYQHIKSASNIIQTKHFGFEEIAEIKFKHPLPMLYRYPGVFDEYSNENVRNFQETYKQTLFMGVDNDYLGSVITTETPEIHWPKPDYFWSWYIGRPEYTTLRFHNESIINPFKPPVTMSRIEDTFGHPKYHEVVFEIQRNSQYTARLKKPFAINQKERSFDVGFKIADPINEVNVAEAALTPPSFHHIQQTTPIDDPMFANLPVDQKALLSFLVDEKGSLPSGMVVPLSQGIKKHFKVGMKASKELAVQQGFKIGFPQPTAGSEAEDEELWKVMVMSIASVAIMAVAPILAGAIFHVESATLAGAVANGGVSFALDAAANGVAYETNLVSHFSIWDSVATGLTAGFGNYFGVTSLTKKAGEVLSPSFKNILVHALMANVNGQLAQMAKNKDYKFNAKSVLNTIAVTTARQVAGINIGGDFALGKMAVEIEQNMMFDILGSTIQDHDINLSHMLARATGNAIGQKVGNELIQSINQNQVHSKLEGPKNTAPKAEQESRQINKHSQPRYNESKHQEALLAVYGELDAANDAFFGHDKYMDNFIDNSFDKLSLNIHSETGEVSTNSLEDRVHAPTLNKGTGASRVASKSGTGKLSGYKQSNARFNAERSKSSSTMFGHRYKNQSSTVEKHASSTKSSGFMDYVDEINKIGDGFASIFLHPRITAQHITDTSVNIAKDIYASRNEPARDIVMRGVFKHMLWQQTATGAEKFGLALNLAATEVTLGALPALGVAAKYGRPLVFEAKKGLEYGYGILTKNYINTPYGKAVQSRASLALGAKVDIANGANLYRGGTLGRSAGPEGQFWSLENPLSSGYAAKYGIPAENMNFNFVEVAKVNPQVKFITRPAPGIGSNAGGGIEVVINPNEATLTHFHMP